MLLHIMMYVLRRQKIYRNYATYPLEHISKRKAAFKTFTLQKMRTCSDCHEEFRYHYVSEV